MADENQKPIAGASAGTEQVNAWAESTAPSTTPMGFDDFLRQPGMQAEFDRRMTKGIETARSKFTDPEVANLKKQLTGYIRRESAIKAGVDQQFLDFVLYSVGSQLNGSDDFDGALKAYLEANQQFCTAASTASAAPTKPAAGWGASQTGKADESAMDGVEAAFRRLNPRLKF